MNRSVSAVAVAVASASAGWAFAAGFDWPVLVAPVVLASVVPVVLLTVAARFGPRLLAVAHVVAPLLLALVHGQAPAALADALVDGPRRLLNITLPAQPRPDLVLVVAAATWLTAAAGTHLALRTRSALAPGVPAVLTLVAASAFVAPVVTRTAVAPVLGLVAAIATLAVVRRRRTPRVVPAVAAVVAVVAGAGITAGQRLGGDPYDPRDRLAVPISVRADLNPLDRVPGYRARPDARLFTVETSSPRPWRLAVLDRFDGQDWTMSRPRFVPAGLGTGAGTVTGVPVRQNFVIDELDGYFLPAADVPVRLHDGVDAVDEETGTLLSTERLRPGRHYAVSSGRASDRVSPGETALPAPVPASVVALAGEVTGESAPLDALETRLRRHGRTDPAAPGGHSYGHVDRLLSGTAVGGAEQYAVAFALVARRLGRPSRIVVGFAPGTREGPALVVRGRDVRVWPEVLLPEGWRGYEPAPQPGAAAAPAPAVTKSVRPSPAPTPSATAAPDARPSASAASSPDDTGGGETGGATGAGLPASYLLAVVLLAVAAYLVTVLAAPPLRRRSRRRAADPRTRAVNAWWDVLEALRGRTPGIAVRTNGQLADHAAKVCPGAAADVAALAVLADHAGFAGEPVGADIAEAAWVLADRIRPRVERLDHPVRRSVRRLAPARLWTVRAVASGRRPRWNRADLREAT
ncbi:DUF3488 and transglutaminase-like domain-containing protein [Asanoa ishikariensis]|uniref:DUF3488 and transglutaminase-like domain-containing protein n=1 Tax=Asanoa ishikariensis TaxID=137265 RepID=UPI0015A2BA22|nr:transglutaminase domain-containing protein [Asanoa ishikariensis]